MRRSTIMIIAGCILALILGVTLAYPMLDSEMPTYVKADMRIDVVYSYISAPMTGQDVAGLGRNLSDGREANSMIFSYIIVLNVTNYSKEFLKITSFSTWVGPDLGMNGNFECTGGTNPIVVDGIEDSLRVYFDVDWQPYQSRLVGITGITGVPIHFYNALNSTIYIYGGISGKVAYTNSYLTNAGVLKHVDFQNVEGDYLYNNLLKEDEMLQIYRSGEYVSVVPRNIG